MVFATEPTREIPTTNLAANPGVSPLSYMERLWNMGCRNDTWSRDMTGQIDGPMLMGIAAIISSTASLITAFRALSRAKEAEERGTAGACEERRGKGCWRT
ncbi:hypothetical protein ACMGDM_16670 [Sphingomonas sp. DT-51]|uniref:hypothetical protein n=1 Tax=Sphingomonas sp. DT-51 TaxID=3396165 RepID=UPI003F1D8865